MSFQWEEEEEEEEESKPTELFLSLFIEERRAKKKTSPRRGICGLSKESNIFFINITLIYIM